MTIAATSTAFRATVKPHEKLVLLYVSQSLDPKGNFRREWLPRLRDWAGFTDLQLEKALLGLRQADWLTDGVDCDGYPALRFPKLSDEALHPQWHPRPKAVADVL